MALQAQTQTGQVLQFPAPSVDAQLEAKLARFVELKEAASEYEKIKKELKPAFEGTESITIGRYTVTGKQVSQPAKIISAFSYWDMRVKVAQ